MKLKPLKIDSSKRGAHLRKRNGKFYFYNSNGYETELLGMHCKAFSADQKYYFSFDAGHFKTKFIDVEISEDDFISLRNGQISFDEIQNKYAVQTD